MMSPSCASKLDTLGTSMFAHRSFEEYIPPVVEEAPKKDDEDTERIEVQAIAPASATYKLPRFALISGVAALTIAIPSSDASAVFSLASALVDRIAGLFG
jgi:hypothetical protein